SGWPLLFAEVKEGKDIPVRVSDLKAPQSIIDERKLLHERRAAPAELVEERVGIQSVDICIPASPSVSGGVWLWQYVRKNGLEHDADSVSAHLAVVHVSLRTLEVELKAEALDVVGNRGLEVPHDEERTDGDEIPVFPFGVWVLRSGLS